MEHTFYKVFFNFSYAVGDADSALILSKGEDLESVEFGGEGVVLLTVGII